MHSRASDIVAAARSCVGTRFRAQGRFVEVGLDCLGVVLVAAEPAGARLSDERDYALAGEDMVRRLAAGVAGAMDAVEHAEAGDVLLLATGPGARHLGVWTGAALIHAHAGLRRVVEGPVEPGWELLGVFRFREG